jgi:SAM-dependent methyltransferase
MQDSYTMTFVTHLLHNITEVLDTGKHRSEEAFTQYMKDMASNASRKAADIIPYLPDIEGPIYDIGCCTGALSQEIADITGEKVIGLDLSQPMIAEAQMNTDQNYLVANGCFPPFQKGSAKALVLSSLFHELYSYGDPPFNKERLKEVFAFYKEILADKGRIIVRDPARPENPKESLYFKPSQEDGLLTTDYQELVETPPDNLSTFSLYLRFIHDFKSLTKQEKMILLSNHNGNLFQAPAWLLSEFLRHRTLTDTLEHWNSEMKEHYGVFTVEETKTFFGKIGLTTVEAKTYFNPKNHSVITNGEVQIWDQSRSLVNRAERLSTNLIAVAEK